MIELEIECKYSCAACALRRVVLRVPARGDEDVKVWMDQTVNLIAADHRRRSPRCRATHITELMIPMPKSTDRVGGPPRH